MATIRNQTANTDPVTKQDIFVLYRICLHREAISELLAESEGGADDADRFNQAMGKLQHTMNKLGLDSV